MGSEDSQEVSNYTRYLGTEDNRSIRELESLVTERLAQIGLRYCVSIHFPTATNPEFIHVLYFAENRQCVNAYYSSKGTKHLQEGSEINIPGNVGLLTILAENELADQVDNQLNNLYIGF